MNPESFLVDIRGGFALRLTGHGEIADFFKAVPPSVEMSVKK